MYLLLITILSLGAIVDGFPTDAPQFSSKKKGPYRVYRIYPNTTSDLEYCVDIWKSASAHQVNFWKEPTRIGSPIDVMVPAHRQSLFEALLGEHKLGYMVTIRDVQKLIEERERPAAAAESKAQPEFRQLLRDQVAEDGNNGNNNQQQRVPFFDFRRYHSYEDMRVYMRAIERRYPEWAKVYSLGFSHEGRPIEMIKIGSPLTARGKKSIWIDAGIHAREWASSTTAMYFIHQLATKNLKDPQITQYVRELNWYITPVLNPDGYEFTRSSTDPEVRMWRKNRAPNREVCPPASARACCMGVDLNRNFDFHWGESGASDNPCEEIYQGSAPFSEPESRAVRDFILAHKNDIQAVITMHTYSQIWVHPFGHQRFSYPPDVDDLRDTGNKAVTALEKLYGTKYKVGSGADTLYPAAGGSDDWSKSKAGIKYVYLLELRPEENVWDGFILDADQILPTARETWEGVKVVTNSVLKRINIEPVSDDPNNADGSVSDSQPKQSPPFSSHRHASSRFNQQRARIESDQDGEITSEPFESSSQPSFLVFSAPIARPDFFNINPFTTDSSSSSALAASPPSAPSDAPAITFMTSSSQAPFTTFSTTSSSAPAAATAYSISDSSSVTTTLSSSQSELSSTSSTTIVVSPVGEVTNAITSASTIVSESSTTDSSSASITSSSASSTDVLYRTTQIQLSTTAGLSSSVAPTSLLTKAPVTFPLSSALPDLSGSLPFSSSLPSNLTSNASWTMIPALVASESTDHANWTSWNVTTAWNVSESTAHDNWTNSDVNATFWPTDSPRNSTNSSSDLTNSTATSPLATSANWTSTPSNLSDFTSPTSLNLTGDGLPSNISNSTIFPSLNISESFSYLSNVTNVTENASSPTSIELLSNTSTAFPQLNSSTSVNESISMAVNASNPESLFFFNSSNSTSPSEIQNLTTFLPSLSDSLNVTLSLDLNQTEANTTTITQATSNSSYTSFPNSTEFTTNPSNLSTLDPSTPEQSNLIPTDDPAVSVSPSPFPSLPNSTIVQALLTWFDFAYGLRELPPGITFAPRDSSTPESTTLLSSPPEDIPTSSELASDYDFLENETDLFFQSTNQSSSSIESESDFESSQQQQQPRRYTFVKSSNTSSRYRFYRKHQLEKQLLLETTSSTTDSTTCSDAIGQDYCLRWVSLRHRICERLAHYMRQKCAKTCQFCSVT